MFYCIIYCISTIARFLFKLRGGGGGWHYLILHKFLKRNCIVVLYTYKGNAYLDENKLKGQNYYDLHLRRKCIAVRLHSARLSLYDIVMRCIFTILPSFA